MQTTAILVVEDERIIALDLCAKLRRLGFAVCGLAHNGHDAVRLAAELRPDLILLDIMLEGNMDGIEALTHIRATQAVPALFISACADRPTRERALAAGCAGIVSKPIDLDTLVTQVNAALVGVGPK